MLRLGEAPGLVGTTPATDFLGMLRWLQHTCALLKDVFHFASGLLAVPHGDIVEESPQLQSTGFIVASGLPDGAHGSITPKEIVDPKAVSAFQTINIFP